jgi:hypothetical protein
MSNCEFTAESLRTQRKHVEEKGLMLPNVRALFDIADTLIFLEPASVIKKPLRPQRLCGELDAHPE